MDRYRSRVHDLYRLTELDVEDPAELLNVCGEIPPVDQYSDVVDAIYGLLHWPALLSLSVRANRPTDSGGKAFIRPTRASRVCRCYPPGLEAVEPCGITVC